MDCDMCCNFAETDGLGPVESGDEAHTMASPEVTPQRYEVNCRGGVNVRRKPNADCHNKPIGALADQSAVWITDRTCAGPNAWGWIQRSTPGPGSRGVTRGGWIFLGLCRPYDSDRRAASAQLKHSCAPSCPSVSVTVDTSAACREVRVSDPCGCGGAKELTPDATNQRWTGTIGAGGGSLVFTFIVRVPTTTGTTADVATRSNPVPCSYTGRLCFCGTRLWE